MLRNIEYTVSPNGVTPHSPQFAGVQGENGATQLTLKLNAEFLSAIEQLRIDFDSVVFRFDCVDGAGRTITGETKEFSEEEITFGLSSAHTEMGGNIKMLFVVSGVNNTQEASVELYSLPFVLYFRDFPVRTSYNERRDLNKAVLQVKEMRAETYQIAAQALESHKLIGEQIQEYEQNYNGANEELKELCATTTAATKQAAGYNQSAAEYAASALTSSVQSAGYASRSEECMHEAKKSAQEAAVSLAELLAVTGDINAVLATVVEG